MKYPVKLTLEVARGHLRDVARLVSILVAVIDVTLVALEKIEEGPAWASTSD